MRKPLERAGIGAAGTRDHQPDHSLAGRAAGPGFATPPQSRTGAGRAPEDGGAGPGASAAGVINFGVPATALLE